MRTTPRGGWKLPGIGWRLAGAWFLPLLVAIPVGWRCGRLELVLLPDKASAFYGYSDGQHGGRSETRLGNRGGSLLVVMDLLPGHPTPYAGFGLSLVDSSAPKGRDLTSYDALEIEMRSPNMRNIGFQVITWVDGFPKPPEDLPGKYLDAAVPIASIFRSVRVPFRDFRPSSWWPQVAGVDADAVPTRWDLVRRIEVRLPIGEQPVRHDTIEVRTLRLVGTDWRPLSGLVFLSFCVSLFLTFRLRARVGGAEPEERSGVSEAPPMHKVELPNRNQLELQSLLAWIGQNYHRESILVEDAARGCGIPARKIPQLLKEHCGKAFPAYVASLRIAEARRLLRQTDRQVGEIALAVGFSNAAHFHRVFRNETGETPAAWREKADGRPEGPPAG